jgi:hypothetical protein
MTTKEVFKRRCLNVDRSDSGDVSVKQLGQRQRPVGGDGDDADGHVVAARDDPRRRKDDVVDGAGVVGQHCDQSETLKLLSSRL